MSQLIFRNGKAILRRYDRPDGTVLLTKTLDQKDEHIMHMTGAPGWDKQAVDEVFTRGIGGTLQYTRQGVRYDIDIADFRKHAFEKDIHPFGVQYHVGVKHYKTFGLRSVAPTRDAAPELPKQLSFGEWLPCPSCKGNRKNGCDVCNHLGYVPWKT